MKIKINDKEYELRITNTLGPSYEFQRMTGRVPCTDARMIIEIAYGSLVLWNKGSFLMTFEDFLQDISDQELVKISQYVSERVVALNTDADTNIEIVEDGQGES